MKSLPCDQALQLLSDLLAGAISPEDADQVETHLVSCLSCRARAAGYGRTDRVLAELAVQDKVSEWLERIRAAAAHEVLLPAPAALGDEHRDGRLLNPQGSGLEHLTKAKQPSESHKLRSPSSPSTGRRSLRTVFPISRRAGLIAGAAAAAAVVLGVMFWPRETGPETALPVALLERIEGDVFVLTQEGGRLPATAGHQFVDGQGLALGEEGRAIVVYPDTTRLELIGETTVRSLSDGRAAGSNTSGRGKRVVLEDGLLRAEVAKQPEGRPMIVVTPEAEVVVRGTRFFLSKTPEAMHVQTDEGLVQVARKGDGKPIDVPAGFAATVAAGKRPPRAERLAPRTNRARATLEGHLSEVLCLAFASDGKTLVSGSGDRTARCWDVATKKSRTEVLPHPSSVGVIACSPLGKTAVTGCNDGILRFWEMESGRLLTSLGGHRMAISAVTFSPNGQVLATGSDDRTVRLWDAMAIKPRTMLRDRTGRVFALQFSPDGKTLYRGNRPRTVQRWDIDTEHMQESYSLPGAMRRIWGMAFSADGTTLATGSKNGVVKLWEVATGRERATLYGHWDSVLCLALSPDSRMLATGCKDGTVKLWDVQAAKALLTLEGHGDAVLALAFAPDGQVLATGSRDKTVKLWDLRALITER